MRIFVVLVLGWFLVAELEVAEVKAVQPRTS